MKRLRWSLAAAADLEAIDSYLRQYHPTFAVPTIQRLYDAAKSLREHPYLGRPGKRADIREMVLAPLPYVLVYSVSSEAIHILRFLHTSRDRQ